MKLLRNWRCKVQTGMLLHRHSGTAEQAKMMFDNGMNSFGRSANFSYFGDDQRIQERLAAELACSTSLLHAGRVTIRQIKDPFALVRGQRNIVVKYRNSHEPSKIFKLQSFCTLVVDLVRSHGELQCSGPE